MKVYKLNPDCPICQHPEREKVDAWLERQWHPTRPGGAVGFIASLFEDMNPLDVIHHERAHRNPDD